MLAEVTKASLRAEAAKRQTRAEALAVAKAIKNAGSEKRRAEINDENSSETKLVKHAAPIKAKPAVITEGGSYCHGCGLAAACRGKLGLAVAS